MIPALLSFQGQLFVEVKASPSVPGAPHHSNMEDHNNKDKQTAISEKGPSLNILQPPASENSGKKLPPPFIKVDSAGSLKDEDSSISSFQVSISSHVSTPFDSILLSQAQELRADVDNIKLNICSALKVDMDKFAIVTPQGIKQCNVLNKFTHATGLLALVNHSERLCATVSGNRLTEVPVSPVPQKSKSVEQTLQTIEKSIMELKDNKKQESMFKSIEQKLDELKLSLSHFNKRCGSDASTPDCILGQAPPFAFNMMMGRPNIEEQGVHKIDQQGQIKPTAHIDYYDSKFLDSDKSSHLLAFLEEYDEKFTLNSESGHGVISFGEPYTYTGAKAVSTCSKDFPGPINGLVSDIKKIYPTAVINQCLINRYKDETASLPKHSDNEESIVHGSSIFTVSVGAKCDVTFSRVDRPEDEKTEAIEGGSLYVMSKDSQLEWQHRIDPSTEARALRYSVTFRYVSKNSSNATIIVGDSNTRHLKFGSGKKTFGDRIPGKRVEAFVIDQMEPQH